MTRVRLAPVVLGLFGVLWCAYPLLPTGNARSLYSDAVAVAALGIGLLRAARIPTTARRGWVLVVLGFAGWVLGDLVFTLEEMAALDAYPAPSDVVYLGSYAVIAAGLLRLVRGRQNRSDPTPVLDAAIVAVGFGILVWTFLVAPISSDSTLSLAGRLVASAYPVADVLLLGVLVRLWSTVGARSAAFHWLLTGLTATMVADITWNLVALRDPRAETPAWLDMLWLLGYLATAAAASSPTARHLGGDVPGEVGASARRRLVALGCGLALPGLALLADGIVTHNVPWITVSIGSTLMSVLVLTRMGLLIRTVEVQAVQLAALARSDGLTGAPNRRTWDHELGRAVQQAEETGEPLAVALVDLDHFKRYNDTFGHQAGDLLLREAVAAWTALLLPGELLARYGGEEFGLVMPGAGVEEAAQRLQLMQSLTPRGQRFSGGVAAWLPGTEPADVVALADRALYDAKHAGRGCVRVANAAHDVPSTPPVQIALQPV
ncbi:MAG: GGDEF domain-containing protein, partial [Micrococcales bacterium]|nr:GGDEF domain-containing protein [Micrococcales bacterium]